jgi:hypothetical protein
LGPLESETCSICMYDQRSPWMQPAPGAMVIAQPTVSFVSA